MKPASELKPELEAAIAAPEEQPVAYACAACQDSGWVIVERAGLSGAQRCSCQSQKIAESVRSAVAIPATYADKNLRSFNFRGNKLLEEIVTDASNYVKEFPTVRPPGIMFSGFPGCGKTHLAVGILKALMMRGFSPRFIDCQSMLELIRKAYDEDEFGNTQLYWDLLGAPVLLIDDLGAMRVTEWSQDTVCQLLTHRCNNALPTIVTTNLPDEDIGGKQVAYMGAGNTPVYRKTLREVIGERARSRLFEMCRLVQMPPVEDYRVAMATRRGNL